jgi:hypothetical protein
MVLLLKKPYIFLYIYIRNVTLLKTLAAPVYEEVESSSCVHSIPLVILSCFDSKTTYQKSPSDQAPFLPGLGKHTASESSSVSTDRLPPRRPIPDCSCVVRGVYARGGQVVLTCQSPQTSCCPDRMTPNKLFLFF